jgi:NADPH:quinone reductase-like Zn-dependent oxidoreductase
MRAVVRHGYGGPEVVSVADVPDPVAGDGEVLVRVHAASVNRADLDQVEPRPRFLRLFLGIRAPRNTRLGCDVAGVVESIGPGVTRFKPGDRVFGDLFPFGQASFAERVAAPEQAFLPIPDGLDDVTAATLPHSAILALQGLRTRDGTTPGPGSRVLVDGASGNTGPFAVQIAKWLGAEVTGVASAGKLDFVRSLGADHVLDYRATDITTAGARYDWIVAADSHHTIASLRRALRPGGRYVTLGGDTKALVDGLVVGPLLGLTSDRRAGLMVWWKPFHEPDVRRLTDLVLARHLRPAVDRVMTLEEAPEALALVHGGEVRGKIVLEIDPGPGAPPS